MSSSSHTPLRIPDKAFPVLQCLLDVLKTVATYPAVPEHPNSGDDGFDDDERARILKEISDLFCKHDLNQAPVSQSEIPFAVENIFASVCDLMQSLPDQDFQRNAIQSNILKFQERLYHQEREQRHLADPQPARRTQTLLVDNLNAKSRLPPSDPNAKRRKSMSSTDIFSQEKAQRRQFLQELSSIQISPAKKDPRMLPEIHGIGARAAQRLDQFKPKPKQPGSERSRATASFSRLSHLVDHTQTELPGNIASGLIAACSQEASAGFSRPGYLSPRHEIARECDLSDLDILETPGNSPKYPRIPQSSEGNKSYASSAGLSSAHLNASPVRENRRPAGSPQYRVSKVHHGSPVRQHQSPTPRDRSRPQQQQSPTKGLSERSSNHRYYRR